MNTATKIILIVLFGCAAVALIALFAIDKYIDSQFETSKTVMKRKVSNKKLVLFATLNKNAQYPHSMSLKIEGNINGTGIIQYGYNKSMCSGCDTVSNQFTFDGGGDWYNDTCYITFTPLTSTKGEITVDCEIYSSEK